MVKSYIFTGFMGCGKSHLFNKFSRYSCAEHVKMVDLDDEILKRSGFSTVKDCVDAIGWNGFRKLEAETLSFLLEGFQENFQVFIFLGGGAFETLFKLEAWNIVSNNYVSCWLDTDFELCLKRIRSDDSCSRPLLSMTDQELYQLYLNRVEKYKTADVRIDENQRKIIKNREDFLQWIDGKDII